MRRFFAQNLAILEQSSLAPKTTPKIAWHESNDVPTASATSLIVIRQLFKIIFITASMISSVVEVLERSGRASS